MSACGSVQHIYEKPLPENPTLIESLSSRKQLKCVKPLDQPSFTDIVGELHFRENLELSNFSSFAEVYPRVEASKLESKGYLESRYGQSKKNQYMGCYKYGHSLQLCTEGLGFESSDDVEDLKIGMNEDWRQRDGKASIRRLSKPENSNMKSRRSRFIGEAFPPPISCIGKSGKPSVCFKSYRHDGRFVLKEERIPTREFLQARREDGRLKLRFFQPNDEVLEEEGEEEEEEDEEEIEEERR